MQHRNPSPSTSPLYTKPPLTKPNTPTRPFTSYQTVQQSSTLSPLTTKSHTTTRSDLGGNPTHQSQCNINNPPSSYSSSKKYIRKNISKNATDKSLQHSARIILAVGPFVQSGSQSWGDDAVEAVTKLEFSVMLATLSIIQCKYYINNHRSPFHTSSLPIPHLPSFVTGSQVYTSRRQSLHEAPS